MAVSERAQEVIDSYTRLKETTPPVARDGYHQRPKDSRVQGPKAGRFKCPECTSTLRTKQGRNSHLVQVHAVWEKAPPAPYYAALRQEPMRSLPGSGYPKPLQPEAPREYISPSMLIADVTIKSCPRCGGDIVYGYDQYGPDVHCLQCGHRIV